MKDKLLLSYRDFAAAHETTNLLFTTNGFTKTSLLSNKRIPVLNCP